MSIRSEKLESADIGLRESGARLRGKRFKCVCAYDGTDFKGWQSQLGGGTIQDFIEARLGEIFKAKIRIHGSGRTDAGVHAKAQIFHFDAPWAHGVSELQKALLHGLPSGIQISKVSLAKPDFHARYSAKGKRYAYNIYEGYAPPYESRYFLSLGRRKLDLEKMRKAAQMLLGTHDFTAFSANRGHDRDNPVKTIHKLEISKRGRKIKILTEGSGYLYKMVRIISGALMEVGFGKLEPSDIEAILEARKRTNKFSTAPAKGLFLEKVFY